MVALFAESNWHYASNSIVPLVALFGVANRHYSRSLIVPPVALIAYGRGISILYSFAVREPV
jgi:hypothetical protein